MPQLKHLNINGLTYDIGEEQFQNVYYGEASIDLTDSNNPILQIHTTTSNFSGESGAILYVHFSTIPSSMRYTPLVNAFNYIIIDDITYANPRVSGANAGQFLDFRILDGDTYYANMLEFMNKTEKFLFLDGVIINNRTSYCLYSIDKKYKNYVDNTEKQTWYGTSSTSAATAAKTSTISNFSLTTGVIVSINFVYSNSVQGQLSLNISSTGAKTIYYQGIATSATNPLLWTAEDILTFIYSGSYWYYIGRDSSVSHDTTLKQPTMSLDSNGRIVITDYKISGTN